jgi:hypothetical protein
LEQHRANKNEAYLYMAKQLGGKKWKEAGAVSKECFDNVLGWFRAVCTLDLANPTYGILDITT